MIRVLACNRVLAPALARFLRAALAAAALVLVPAPQVRADAVAPALRARLDAAGPGERVQVIVGLADRLDIRAFASGDKAQRRAALIRALQLQADRAQPPLISLMQAQGGARIRPLWAINAIAAELPVAAIEALARHPAVARIRLDAEVPAPGVVAAAAETPEWNVDMVRAPELWALGYDGAGVVVANMDSGVDALHPDLAPRWRGGSNSWYDPSGQHAAPYDASGHGTQTMGLMVGGSTGGTAIGVAPGAQWIAVKIFNDAGRATLSGIHQGFQWLLDPDGNPASDDAPAVINNSWGLNGADQCYLEFQADIQLLKAAGIAVVFAAGNDGPDGYTSSSPANNPEGYAVGALDAASAVAAFSSRGPSACDGTPYPEVTAPGAAVRSTDLSFGGRALYADVSGTSYAAPQVAGVMAQLIQAHPAVEVPTLEEALARTARDLGVPGADNAYGHGLVDAFAAHAYLAAAPQPGNRAPLASNDAYGVLAGTVLAVAAPGVLGNDSDPDGDALAAQLDTPPAGGTLALNADGSFSYVPNAGTSADSFSYRASDGSLASAAVQVSISVAQPNRPPVAADDAAATKRNTATAIAVLANDADPDGRLDPASVAIASKPTRGGKASANPDGTVSYSPKRNFVGTDSFAYTVRDELGAVSNAATVSVQVTR